MNKYVLLALVGSASAKQHKELIEVLTDLYSESSSKCPNVKEDHECPILSGKARKFIGGAWKGLAKGFYQADGDVIPDDCMGSWVDDEVHQIAKVIKEIKVDSYNVDLKEAKTGVDAGLRIYYKTRDQCQIGKMKNDGWSWCLDNMEQCLYS